jgi:hypothetical protein
MKEDRRGEHHRVEPIEHAAVSLNHVAQSLTPDDDTD